MASSTRPAARVVQLPAFMLLTAKMYARGGSTYRISILGYEMMRDINACTSRDEWTSIERRG